MSQAATLPQTWESSIEPRTTTAADGTRLTYRVLGQGQRPLLIANGLGARLYSWEPLLAALWQDYRILSWDYRGLFDSGPPSSQRRLGIAHHAEDARALLDAEGISRASMIGWSMGVQVVLELASTAPERVEKLVLLNGTYGHTISTGFQPLWPVPTLHSVVHAGLEYMRRHPGASTQAQVVGRLSQFLMNRAVFSLTAEPARRPELEGILRRYFSDVLGDSFSNYLRLFQELDAHSVYHVLPEIQAPSLLISGGLDLLTPARQSFKMARRMPNVKHLHLLRSSHFSLLERPNDVVPPVLQFLTEQPVFRA